MNIRISSLAGDLPVYMLNAKNSTKKQIKLPAAEKGMAMMSASALAMILPADSFLKKTNHEPMQLTDYVKRGNQWYEKHYPMDGSDYYHETACEDPYSKKYNYSGS